uniref:Integrase, catalytic region, zinc finger, CCHC-type, peptidase aspartic, catalytic n=1 Tax=Tanacetum cinerariifolium TaxID=118510 RepID=A0A6L2L6T6_TANCI|nr:integrase, catalytic region, zinc finger, CCHC-type, peptidase aspartic, catalytic [Tanacetum cinerariifolium]
MQREQVQLVLRELRTELGILIQADERDAFDSDVDEAPTAQTMFIENISFANVVCDEAGPSYDSNILSEYVMDNAESVVQKTVSSVPHDTPLMIINEMHEPTAHGQEIVKSNHARVLVHDSDTLEIAKTTRKQMNEKMKDPECVKKKVKIAPHEYSKENYLATFTPQKQLTPEQIFWSKDLIKMKAEALKEQNPALRPIKALMVYPLNTPAMLVPRAQINEKMKCVTKDSVTSKVLAPSMYAIDVVSLPPHCRNNREVHLDYLKHLKEIVATLREIVKEAQAARPLDGSLASACLYTKHSQDLTFQTLHLCLFSNAGRTNHPLVFGLMLLKTYDMGSLIAQEFFKKFIGTVRFGNDHFGTIMGYGDYAIGDSVTSRVYYVEGLRHNLFSVGQFCDSDLEVTFRKHSFYVRDTYGVEFGFSWF